MLTKSLVLQALAFSTGGLITADGSSSLGYSTNTPSTLGDTSLNFGRHYAVLNLDLINALVGSVNTTKEGKSWIGNTATWINAVHEQDPPPLCIYTRIYFSNSQRPEIGADTPFLSAINRLGNLTESSPEAQVYSAFKPSPDHDVELRKSRYYGGAGNSLEEILSSQHIDTVILSGIRTSGVILSTALRLFDLNYKVYVISNNTIETAPDTPGINDAILQGIFPKMPVSVVTIEQALSALKDSGPAV